MWRLSSQSTKLHESKETIQSKGGCSKESKKGFERRRHSNFRKQDASWHVFKDGKSSIHKESRETSPKGKIKKVWKLNTGGLNAHARIGDSYGNDSLDEDTHSINDDHSMVEENPSVEEDLEMTLLLF